METIDAVNGLFAVRRSERDGFRAFLSKLGIQCDVISSGGGWTESDSARISQAELEQLKPMRSEDIEKMDRLYRTWRAVEQGGKVYYAGMGAFGHPTGNQELGLIQVVEAPESKTQTGVATNTGKAKNGRGLYQITLFGNSQQLGSDWVLDNGLFVQS
jgi:hypothetical protein